MRSLDPCTHTAPLQQLQRTVDGGPGRDRLQVYTVAHRRTRYRSVEAGPYAPSAPQQQHCRPTDGSCRPVLWEEAPVCWPAPENPPCEMEGSVGACNRGRNTLDCGKGWGSWGFYRPIPHPQPAVKRRRPQGPAIGLCHCRTGPECGLFVAVFPPSHCSPQSPPSCLISMVGWLDTALACWLAGWSTNACSCPALYV